MGMPPPSRLRPARRTSFARRDSNLALLGALFAGVVLAFALLLLLLQRVNPELGARMRGATADALSPVISVARAPVNGLRRIGGAIADHRNVVAENRRLRSALARAEAQAAETAKMAAEVKRMDSLIGLRRPERRLVASAMASAVSAGAGQRQAIISAGLSDGVRPRMPVIAADGLAGRVTDVGQTAARMMLLTDADSRVPVKVLRTGWTGLAVGNGGTLLEFQFDIASGTDRIRVGDRLVTSGDGGLYPPGVPVGVIVNADSNPPRARPLANPTGLGAVMVEAPWLASPTVLPVAPAPGEVDRPVAAAPAPSGGAPPAGGATGGAGTPPPSRADALAGRLAPPPAGPTRRTPADS